MIKVIKINSKKYLDFIKNIKRYEIQWTYQNKEYKTDLFFNSDNQEITVSNEHIKKNKDGEFSGYSGKVTNSKIAKKEEIEKIKDQLKNELNNHIEREA
ncbi:hypothetical protein AB0Y20_01315 [Heyndrickxia oleronia]|uniref:hypothetical protein n=1 Tax=Heyndrickxia oleronia TaxID=38875 RepID=UPI003F2459A0